MRPGRGLANFLDRRLRLREFRLADRRRKL
jgi:hypothetical protein